VVKKVSVRTLADRRWIRLLSVNKPLFLAPLPGIESSLNRLVLHLTLFYIYFIVYLQISNPYYLENHFVLFLFLFLFCCLDGVRQPPRGRTGEIAKGLR
jgi:hypothetical protein